MTTFLELGFDFKSIYGSTDHITHPKTAATDMVVVAELDSVTIACMDTVAFAAFVTTLKPEQRLCCQVLRDGLLAATAQIKDAFELAQDEAYSALHALFEKHEFAPLWRVFTATHPRWAELATTCECEDLFASCALSALMEQPQFELSSADLCTILSSYCGENMVNRGAATALLVGTSNASVVRFRKLLATLPELDKTVRASLRRAERNGDLELEDEADEMWLRGNGGEAHARM